MTAKELRTAAERINAHLERFEADPVINAEQEVGSPGRTMMLRPFHQVQAYATRQYVLVRYVSYQGEARLTGEEAKAYLARLDAGFVGTHRQALK